MARKHRTDLYRLVPTTTEQHEASQFSQRVNSAIKSATNVGATLLIALRTEDGMRDYIALPASAQSKTAAENFAEAVSSEARLVSPIEDAEDHRELSKMLTGAHIARAEYPRDSVGKSGNYTAAGAQPLEASRIVPTILTPGQWFAISARQPTRSEFRDWGRWFNAATEGSVSTHPSLETNSVVIEVYSGAMDSKSEAKANLTEVLAAMPGFDASPTPRILPDRSGALMTGMLAALAVFAALVVPGIVTENLAGQAAEHTELINTILVTLLFGISGLLVVDTLARIAKLHRTAGQKLRDGLATFRVPVDKRLLPARAPQKEVSHPQRGIVKKASEGDYPLTGHAIRTAPAIFASVFSPSAGVVSGEARTARRDVDTRFAEKIGPLVAETSGINIHLSAAAASFGTSFLGAAGSGKSQTLRSVFGYSCLERVRPSGIPGAPGRNNTLIAIENKGPDGADEYIRWASAMGDTLEVIDIADETTAAIDLFGSSPRIEEQASYFVDLMKSGFAEGEIGSRAVGSLKRTLTAGLAVDDDVIEEANEAIGESGEAFPLGASPLTYAHILLGGWTGGDEDAIRLYGAIRTAAKDYEDGDEDIDEEAGEDYIEAAKQLAFLFHSKTPAQRAGLVESSENKIAQLRGLEGFFAPKRRAVDLYKAIENHEALVINLGPSISGIQVPEYLTKIFSAMVTHAVRDAVAETCSGWQAKNRWVSLFGDELSLLAGSSPEIVTWFREQGRSFGVRAYFATQRPNQLADEVRESFLGADTLFAYRQSSATVVESVLAEIALDGEKWTAQDITKLPNYTAIIRTTLDGTRQNSFVAAMIEFESRRQQFAALQGYDETEQMPAAPLAAATVPADSAPTLVAGADYDYVASDYDNDVDLED